MDVPVIFTSATMGHGAMRLSELASENKEHPSMMVDVYII